MPVIRHWNGRPLPYTLPQLVLIAVEGRLEATSPQVLAAWEFEQDGRRYLALAVGT